MVHTLTPLGFSRTGLPKAAEINQGKLWGMSSLMSLAGVRASDVIYTSLPLYHSAAFLGFTSTIERGTHTVTCTLTNGGILLTKHHCVNMGNMFKGLKEIKGSSLKSGLNIKRTSHKIKQILVDREKVKRSFFCKSSPCFSKSEVK